MPVERGTQAIDDGELMFDCIFGHFAWPASARRRSHRYGLRATDWRWEHNDYSSFGWELEEEYDDDRRFFDALALAEIALSCGLLAVPDSFDVGQWERLIQVHERASMAEGAAGRVDDAPSTRDKLSMRFLEFLKSRRPFAVQEAVALSREQFDAFRLASSRLAATSAAQIAIELIRDGAVSTKYGSISLEELIGQLTGRAEKRAMPRAGSNDDFSSRLAAPRRRLLDNHCMLGLFELLRFVESFGTLLPQVDRQTATQLRSYHDDLCGLGPVAHRHLGRLFIACWSGSTLLSSAKPDDTFIEPSDRFEACMNAVFPHLETTGSSVETPLAEV